MRKKNRLVSLPSPSLREEDGSGARPVSYVSRSDILADIEDGKSIAYAKEIAEIKCNLSSI